jgi:hypothetical protein
MAAIKMAAIKMAAIVARSWLISSVSISFSDACR